MVVEHFALLHILHIYLIPVATAARNGVSHIAAIFRKVNRLQRHSAIVGEFVWVEHFTRRAIERVHFIQHALILQTIVLIEEVFTVMLERNAHLLIVLEFHHLLFQGIAERNLRNVVLGHLVFGFHPSGGFGRIVVLQPAVRVSHLHAKILIYLVHGLGFRISNR